MEPVEPAVLDDILKRAGLATAYMRAPVAGREEFYRGLKENGLRLISETRLAELEAQQAVPLGQLTESIRELAELAGLRVEG